MKKLIVLILSMLFSVRGQNYEGEQLEIDYYTKLIEESIANASTYTPRSNNFDFFANLTDEHEIEDYGAFDFIVIGGGTTGSVVATRLSEKEHWNVLLLEAGTVDDNVVSIPYIFPMMQLSDRNWGYLTTDQSPHACLGTINNQCDYTRGKVLGGSSALNAYMWNRGNQEDYDRWFRQGNPGWSWESILPLFKRIENFESDTIDTRYRGFGGPINAAYHQPMNENEFNEFVKAHEKLGIPYLTDYLNKDPIGFSRLQLNIQRGRRVTAASAYVRPNWKRRNFNVTLRAYVTKVVINPITMKATSVEFVRNGRKYCATAKKEIILSAGAANSPQLLMLSGIGPCEKLNKLGIECLYDSPVGRRLIDHPFLLVPMQTNQPPKPVLPLKKMVEQYLHGYGPLTNLGNNFGITLYDTKDPKSKYPNIELLSGTSDQVCMTIPNRANLRPEIAAQLAPTSSCSFWRMVVSLLHPKSTGTLDLQSADPKDFPLINLGMLSHEDDVQAIYEGIRLSQKIASLMPYNITFPAVPFCSEHKFDTREYWFCFIRYLTFPMYHISGTAKMGPRHDPLAVVDHELKVYGVKNLRVADCSIIPKIISGHTVAPAYVIGEKVSDMIKKEYRSSWEFLDTDESHHDCDLHSESLEEETFGL